MSISSGFYDAALVDGKLDREYSTLQMGSIFDGIINDGVYMSIGNRFMVKASSGMQVLVGSGRAWVNHSWLYNDTDYPIMIETSEAAQNRIDTIYLEINRDVGVRAGSIKCMKGTPALSPVPPKMTNTPDIHQYPIADVYVKAETRAIGQSNITNRVGTSALPFVSGIINTINTDELIVQWEAQFEVLYAHMNDELKNRLDALQSQIDQVTQGVIPNGSVSSRFKMTITPGNWISDDVGVHKQFTLNGIKVSDDPVVDINFESISDTNVPDVLGSWTVYKVKTLDNAIIVYSESEPDVNIPIKIRCVRK